VHLRIDVQRIVHSRSLHRCNAVHFHRRYRRTGNESQLSMKTPYAARPSCDLVHVSCSCAAGLAVQLPCGRRSSCAVDLSFMRFGVWLVIVLASSSTACAARRDTGAALVTAGALAAGIGASAASNSRCTSFGCYPQSPSATGAKIAVAGLAVAAAGYAVMANAPQDRPRPPSFATTSDPNAAWRLVRREPPPPENETETEGNGDAPEPQQGR